MSVAQIKKEILLLTSADRREVEAYLRELTQKDSQAEPVGPQPPRRQRFEEAKAHLFDHYGDLLEKLAK